MLKFLSLILLFLCFILSEQAESIGYIDDDDTGESSANFYFTISSSVSLSGFEQKIGKDKVKIATFKSIIKYQMPKSEIATDKRHVLANFRPPISC